MKKLLALVLVLSLVLCLFVGCQPSTPAETPTEPAAPTDTEPAAPTDTEPAAPDTEPAPAEGGLVGVAMPTNDLQRWNQDGANMKAKLEEAGYTVDLQFGANDIPKQVSQIENMISNGCKVLVIASIEGKEYPRHRL